MTCNLIEQQTADRHALCSYVVLIKPFFGFSLIADKRRQVRYSPANRRSSSASFEACIFRSLRKSRSRLAAALERSFSGSTELPYTSDSRLRQCHIERVPRVCQRSSAAAYVTESSRCLRIVKRRGHSVTGMATS
jgi:hypothetical protein